MNGDDGRKNQTKLPEAAATAGPIEIFMHISIHSLSASVYLRGGNMGRIAN